MSLPLKKNQDNSLWWSFDVLSFVIRHVLCWEDDQISASIVRCVCGVEIHWARICVMWRSLTFALFFAETLVVLQAIRTNTDPFGFDCLSNFAVDSGISPKMKYCIRPGEALSERRTEVASHHHSQFSFAELHASNVTSSEILSWSSSIDLAEDYQHYVEQFPRSDLSKELFFNCTSPWFGSQCQYAVEMDRRSTSTNEIIGQTCYILLECDRGESSLCLDWREICDGRIDCLNGGIDETAQCFQLEINECDDNEYRCHNGLCISRNFWLEKSSEPVCFDTSDSHALFECPDSHSADDPFACEEYACRPGQARFSCGDGQCVEDFDRCHSGRDLLLIEAMGARGNLSFDCWISMVCLTKIKDHILCEESMASDEMLDRLQTCESPLLFPIIPVVLGHVRFLYDLSERIEIDADSVLLPTYVCYDEHLCDHLIPTFRHENWTCRHAQEINLEPDLTITDWKSLIGLIKSSFLGCTTQSFSKVVGHSTKLYSCLNSSKKISTHRLIDGLTDCPLNDDERAFELSCSLNQPHRFRCPREIQCRSPIHSSCDGDWSDPGDVNEFSFYQLCDRFVDLPPITIDERNHSDETDCEPWPCNNLYTRCDGFWNCENGEDEENCRRQICPSRYHPCVSPENFTVICLVAHQVQDGRIDCLGASDERQYCRADKTYSHTYEFRCWNDTTCLLREALCNGVEDCPLGDDEHFCGNRTDLCLEWNPEDLTDVEYLLCGIGNIFHTPFSLDTALIYPSLPFQRSIPVKRQSPRWGICQRGIAMRLDLNTASSSFVCFCPSNYYGDRCQYQNERVSLTLTLATVDHQIIYALVVTLFDEDDDQQTIHSVDQLIRVPKFHCGERVNIYLLFAHRPKNISKPYSVRIDVFDKSSLVHLASWHLAIPFVFLPVNRLTAFLTLPVDRVLPSCTLRCHRGTCTKYLNKERFFCRCQSGWSGMRCDRSIDCSQCSKDSICVGAVANRSICVCPPHKFGSRCLLTQTCPTNFCENNGRCVVLDQQMADESYVCLCSEPFFGPKCELVKHRLEISLRNVELSSYFFTYIFIDMDVGQPTPTFIVLQKVMMFQNTVVVYSQLRFEMILIQFGPRYYRGVLRRFNDSNTTSTSISPAQQCVSIEGLFSAELLSMPRIHRMKSYHLPCQRHGDLPCFMDEIYLCLCTVDHQSNCFAFDQQKSFDCDDNVYCQNGGNCLQDRPICLFSILCVCKDCFFGDRCQFYAKGIGLTLDDMLRYVIQPHVPFRDQSVVVKWSAAVTVIIFLVGSLNSFLAFLVFNHRNMCQVGSGVYLLLSSIVSFLVVSMLMAKFWFVLLTHMNPSIDQSILRFGCILLEPGLKLFLCMNQWLNAFVAFERAMAVFKGIRFNKRRSRRLARWLRCLLPFAILGSMIHEFFYRDLFDDYEEQRLWCVFHYSFWVDTYSTTIQLIHFVVPFCANLFSAFFIIFNIARQRAAIRTRYSYEQQLRKQFSEHRQLLVSPVVLVILAFPRFIISLLSGCVKASRNPWLLLAGYFISFVPSACVFVIFVLPSTLYKRQFRDSLTSWRQRITGKWNWARTSVIRYGWARHCHRMIQIDRDCVRSDSLVKLNVWIFPWLSHRTMHGEHVALRIDGFHHTTSNLSIPNTPLHVFGRYKASISILFSSEDEFFSTQEKDYGPL